MNIDIAESITYKFFFHTRESNESRDTYIYKEIISNRNVIATSTFIKQIASINNRSNQLVGV